MRVDEKKIVQELECLCKEYKGLSNRSDMDSRRRPIRNHLATRVFKDYCPLYWKKDKIQNAGLEISNAIQDLAKNYNPEKGDFSHYLSRCIKNAIEKGCLNASVGNTKNNQKLNKAKIADSENVLNNQISSPHHVCVHKIDESTLNKINDTWNRENTRHKPFLSLYLNSIFYEFDDYAEKCSLYECLKLTISDFIPGASIQEMAAKFGIEKTNASQIIKRFKAKLPPIKFQG